MKFTNGWMPFHVARRPSAANLCCGDLADYALVSIKTTGGALFSVSVRCIE
jgi:hypothetical protein